MLWEKKSMPVTNPSVSTPTPNLVEVPVRDPLPRPHGTAQVDTNQTALGPSVVLKGDLSGAEDTRIEGQFDGTINLRDHCLSIGLHGQVKAGIQASRVVIHGSVTGNIAARERIEIRKTGRVMGDLVAPSIAIEDGAYFKGSIEILREEAQESPKAGATLSSIRAEEAGA